MEAERAAQVSEAERKLQDSGRVRHVGCVGLGGRRWAPKGRVSKEEQLQGACLPVPALIARGKESVDTLNNILGGFVRDCQNRHCPLLYERPPCRAYFDGTSLLFDT